MLIPETRAQYIRRAALELLVARLRSDPTYGHHDTVDVVVRAMVEVAEELADQTGLVAEEDAES